ncbi:polymorphic toxin-type HINT domain-containing protein [Phascolarctobacterium sp.]|uniref:polymorphic toxin-type HINT domain-containing protein n=1 Tax=Phascolarctobacterium sp. TaxID=2049039 RepID=UPI003AB25071
MNLLPGQGLCPAPIHCRYLGCSPRRARPHGRNGDILVLLHGQYVVVEWVQHELLESPVSVFNFQVADYHTYYVSNMDILTRK